MQIANLFQGKGLKKISTFLSVAVISGLLLSGCGSSTASTSTGGNSKTGSESSDNASSDSASGETTTIRYGLMTGATEHFIAVIGQEKGIYEKHGIDLQITEFASGMEAIGAVTTEQVDIAESMDYATINRIGTTSDKTNLVIFGQNYVAAEIESAGSAGNQFYINPKSLSSIGELKGKSVSVALGTVNEYQNAKAYEKAGLTKDDIKEVSVGGITEVVALAERGDIDASWATSTSAEKLIELGWKPVLKDSEVGLRTLDVAVTSKTFAENTDVLADYIEARDEIVNYIHENTDEAAQIADEKTGIGVDMFKSMIAANDQTFQLTKDAYDTFVDIKDWAYKNGNFDTDYNVDDFLDTSALEKAFPDRVTYK